MEMVLGLVVRRQLPKALRIQERETTASSSSE
jgi:hypothetical protein